MTQETRGKRTFKRLLAPALGALVLIVLILYMGGVFRTGQIGPEETRQPPAAHPLGGDRALARMVELPQFHQAIGTLKTRTAVHLEAQVPGRVAEVAVRSGDPVRAGQLLVRIDDRELVARHQQARQALNAAIQQKIQAERAVEAARAAFDQVSAQYERIRGFLAAQAATRQEMEAIEAQWRQAQAAVEQALAGLAAAEAGVEAARQRLGEAEAILDHTRLLSPLDGQVVTRHADPGDLALPGKPLLSLQADEALRLEALVPETLIKRLARGQKVEVLLGERRFGGMIDEMVPAADPRSRSFVVKVSLDAPHGFFPGMFGRLLVPLDLRPAVLVPAAAILRVGQLEMVQVVEDELPRTRLVTTGEHIADEVEILSGLRGGEQLVLSGARP